MHLEENDQESNDLRRSVRSIRAPNYMKDYHHNISSILNTVSVESILKVMYSISSVLSYNVMNQKQLQLISSISSHVEPKSFEVVKIPHWKEVMRVEFEALKANDTWYITKLPPGKSPIGCKWFFKLKFNVNGEVEHHKAKLVAKGYTQTEGVDYQDTYSPVAKMTTSRLLIVASRNPYMA